jgi:hypothetical protein
MAMHPHTHVSPGKQLHASSLLTAEALRQYVSENYALFIDTSKEVVTIESDMLKVRVCGWCGWVCMCVTSHQHKIHATRGTPCNDTRVYRFCLFFVVHS